MRWWGARAITAASAIAVASCSSSSAPAPAPPPKSPQECVQSTPKTFARVSCLEPYVRSVTLDKSAAEAMCEARGFVADGTVEDCHWLAHTIGEANLDKNGGDVAKAFATCPLGCIEGCFHGAISSWIAGRDRASLARDLLTLCDGYNPGSLLQRQCVHGVGHGLLMHGRMTLTDAVATCRSRPEPDFQSTCLGGVMMENFNLYIELPQAKLAAVLPTICDGLSIDDANECGRAIGEGLMFYTGHDINRTLQLCSTSVDPKLVAICRAAAFDELGTPKDSACF